MSAPRFRQHTDGRAAVEVLFGWGPAWVVAHGNGKYAGTVGSDYVHGEGWSEAALVVLPGGMDVQREFATARRFGRVSAQVRCDGEVFIDSGVQGYRTPDEARSYGAALIAAADWVTSRRADR